MNVTCPNCATVYRVDPAKVPEAGVRARCAVCSAVFSVRRDMELAAPSLAAPSSEAAPTTAATAAAPPPPAAPAPTKPAPAEVRAPAAPARPAGPPRPAAPAAFAAGSGGGRPTASPTEVPEAAREAPRPAPPVAARPVNPFLSQDPALKARRLARALISDMVVYHPAKRQEGLRDGTLKELFQDEIKKSWEEYTEQVGRDVAESSPYFREALNEILAGGKQIF